MFIQLAPIVSCAAPYRAVKFSWNLAFTYSVLLILEFCTGNSVVPFSNAGPFKIRLTFILTKIASQGRKINQLLYEIIYLP